MKMIIIESCKKCPHIDHSGNFTLGGAKPMCGEGSAVNPKENRPFLKYRTMYNDLTDRPYRVLKGPIPSWCPLPDSN